MWAHNNPYIIFENRALVVIQHEYENEHTTHTVHGVEGKSKKRLKYSITYNCGTLEERGKEQGNGAATMIGNFETRVLERRIPRCLNGKQSEQVLELPSPAFDCFKTLEPDPGIFNRSRPISGSQKHI